ncbi:MAG: hypothetical protein ACREPL_14440 [Rhodanobacteraceae bacterium]
MLWARFLKWYFGCDDLALLNAQLLLPITQNEVFQLGENPVPLPPRIAPKAFERAYWSGRSPDGSYTCGIYNGSPKFNLYERVVARVPESKYWLLKELDHYFIGCAPSIDVSARVARTITQELGLLLIERDFIEAWASVDATGVAAAETSMCNALVENVLPEYVALMLALLHLSVWHEPPRTPADLPSKLFALSVRIAHRFTAIVESIGLDDGKVCAQGITDHLKRATVAILSEGTRSESTGKLLPPNVAKHFVLVPDTAATRAAAIRLFDATEPHGCASEWVRGMMLQLSVPKPQRRSTHEPDARRAAARLRAAATEVPNLLADRAARRLHRYRGPTARARLVQRLPS